MPVTSVRSIKGDGWASVLLSSRRGLNKLGTGTLRPLLAELRSCLVPECRCLAIVGEGGSFAVGADLREIGGLTPTDARTFSDLGNGIFRLLERSASVVVAGIDGFCLGGGLDLALAADWRMASTRSVFGHPGADLGLITGFGGTQRLPRLIGQRRAARWLLSAERVPAGEAYREGFLQEICRPEQFEERLMSRIQRFAAMPAERIREVKLQLRHGSDRLEAGR
ncbi:MAG: enoyl-CoA hydratase/isomerase family protein [bacterium]|nr:MAG: enoyl-CoA hydratase/isomerase family protein [bacterium]